jgi:ferric-dicitrate binding protein FerR (iron transport regulator)
MHDSFTSSTDAGALLDSRQREERERQHAASSRSRERYAELCQIIESFREEALEGDLQTEALAEGDARSAPREGWVVRVDGMLYCGPMTLLIPVSGPVEVASPQDQLRDRGDLEYRALSENLALADHDLDTVRKALARMLTAAR